GIERERDIRVYQWDRVVGVGPVEARQRVVRDVVIARDRPRRVCRWIDPDLRGRRLSRQRREHAESERGDQPFEEATARDCPVRTSHVTLLSLSVERGNANG